MAIAAWNEIAPARTSARGGVLVHSEKSIVVRLECDGTAERGIIAKRAAHAAVATEAHVYGLLSSSGILSPDCLGVGRDADPAIAWLFTAEVAGTAYDPAHKDHAVLAARWLASLHATFRADRFMDQLPRHDASVYLRRLREARASLRQRLAACLDDGEASDVLEQSIDLCDALEGRWQHIAGMSGVLPDAVVHGDIAPENVRIAGDAVYVFDWEKAGFGTPAVDISRIDLHGYCASMPQGRVNAAEVERAARCGAIFRTLSHDWSAKSIRKLDLYRRRLSREVRAAGLMGDRA
jgi:aminoglycoside phosphotransferase (APT) family kinase protein